MANDELVDAKTLEAESNIAEKTWANWRSQGIGPKYLKLRGHVRYRRSDVDAWLTSCERNTSDAA
jgi:predicted DNA-binding transcriptional regulator AlpA